MGQFRMPRLDPKKSPFGSQALAGKANAAKKAARTKVSLPTINLPPERDDEDHIGEATEKVGR